ncbi:MAG: pyridoxamine 5'-phosphate oxidase family protein, partial [Prolixibacteraceae bacterium]|nr:pyridoxamine 5'-phosphate oxidase family protein [Prolixibacteraceae bacterium]
MKIENIRKEYLSGTLSEGQLTKNPMDLFKTWFTEAINSGTDDANAMVLSTIGLDGFPDSRVVLLKSLESNSFFFFTNFKSQKGKSIENNNKVSLTFFWPEFQRQVRIKGLTE